jgi:mono/diheme cytochrome c family protein
VKPYSNALFLVVALGCCAVAFAIDPPPPYVRHCISCHAADGSGRASSAIGKIPDLRSKTIVRLSDPQLFDTIARGNGHQAYAHSFLNQGVSESELRGIVRYIRSIQSESSAAVSVKPNSSR